MPLIRQGDELVEASWAEALAWPRPGLAAAKAAGGGASLAVIGGARLPNEDAYVWAKVARLALGTDNVDAQLGDGLPAATVLGLPRATIDQAAPGAARDHPRPGHQGRAAGPVSAPAPRRPGERHPARRADPGARPGCRRYAAATVLLPARRGGGAGGGRRRPAPVTGDVAGVPPATIEAVRAHIARAREMGRPGRAIASSSSSAGRRWPSRRSRWRRRPGYWPICPGWPSCPPCAGPTCTAPSTWAWRPGVLPAGSGSTPAGPGTSTTGARALPGRPAVSTRPGSWRPPAGAGSGGWCSSAPTPAPTSPTPTWPCRACTGPASSSPSTPT